MGKIHKTKPFIILFVIAAFIFNLVPIVTPTADAAEIISASDMLHFKMKVRWGNVLGELEDIKKTNFDGSISVQNGARISIENTLLFDEHNETADKITSKTDTSILWNSLIYNHWDGVLVVISAPASSYLTLDIGGNKIEKTAQEFYSTSDEIIQNVGNGREIVIKSYKVVINPSYFLKVYWGKIERSGYAEECIPTAIGGCKTPLLNANGSFKIDSGGKLQLVKTLRFEPGDAIISKSDTEIKWNSRLYGGIDGILVNLKLNADELDIADTVTINFDNHSKPGFPKSYSIVNLYHNGITKDIITSDGYGVAFEVWKRPNRTLIRVKNNPMVYMVEDGMKMPIQSPTVLFNQGLSFSDVQEVEQEEADTYANSEPLNYADGTIVREKNKPEVYVVADGQKKHILDPNSFTALGYNWNNIVIVPANSLGIFKNSTPMNSNSIHPEGALIRVEGTPTVYVIKGGKKVPISDIQLFNTRKYDWKKVLVVKNNQANKFDTGSALSYPDGSLIRDNSGKVYVIDQGKKRLVRSFEDFKKSGYDESRILNVGNSVLSKFEEGSDIVANDIK